MLWKRVYLESVLVNEVGDNWRVCRENYRVPWKLFTKMINF